MGSLFLTPIFCCYSTLIVVVYSNSVVYSAYEPGLGLRGLGFRVVSVIMTTSLIVVLGAFCSLGPYLGLCFGSKLSESMGADFRFLSWGCVGFQLKFTCG